MGNFLSFSKQPPQEFPAPEPTSSTPETEQTPAPKVSEPVLLDYFTLVNNKPSKSEIINPENCFSVLSYNILAECYAHFLSKTIHEKYLDISYRSALIVEELRQISSDIFCLQEIDNYTRIYKVLFQELGYNTVFVPRFNMRGDGCAIGVKKDKFDIVEHTVLDLDKGHDYENKTEFTRGNIAVFVTLKHKASKKVIKVICSHLYWDPKFEHVKYLQMSQILSHVDKVCSKDDIVIWAGDFNSKPRSNLIRFILEGKLPKQKKMEFKSEDNLDIMRTICEKLKGIPKKVEWGNVYENYKLAIGEEETGYPAYTNYTMKFKDVIDHILYSKKK